MKRLISILLSLLLLNQSVLVYAQGRDVSADNQPDLSFFSIPRLPKAEVNRQCQFRFMRDVCAEYRKFGVKRSEAWEAYDTAYWSQQGAYWKLSPSQLYDKYEAVSKDIAHLWEINPEYIDMKRGERITKIIIAWDITVIAVLAGTVIAPILEGAGLHMAAQVSSLLPNTAGVGGAIAGKSIRMILRGILQKMATGIFWADVGVSLAYMVVDTLFVEGAFYLFRQTATELEALQGDINIEYAMKSRGLLQEIIGANLSEADQKELEKNKDEIYNLNQELKRSVKKALEEQGWGENKLVQREAVVTLYALEYIRAEMADMSDSLRYREAAIDISQVYFSGDLTNLYEDRLELFNMLSDAYWKKIEDQKARAEKILDMYDGTLVNMSNGKVGYFRIGMR